MRLILDSCCGQSETAPYLKPGIKTEYIFVMFVFSKETKTPKFPLQTGSGSGGWGSSMVVAEGLHEVEVGETEKLRFGYNAFKQH